VIFSINDGFQWTNELVVTSSSTAEGRGVKNGFVHWLVAGDVMVGLHLYQVVITIEATFGFAPAAAGDGDWVFEVVLRFYIVVIPEKPDGHQLFGIDPKLVYFFIAGIGADHEYRPALPAVFVKFAEVQLEVFEFGQRGIEGHEIEAAEDKDESVIVPFYPVGDGIMVEAIDRIAVEHKAVAALQAVEVDPQFVGVEDALIPDGRFNEAVMPVLFGRLVKGPAVVPFVVVPVIHFVQERNGGGVFRFLRADNGGGVFRFLRADNGGGVVAAKKRKGG
jgi:hypothetical protein